MEFKELIYKLKLLKNNNDSKVKFCFDIFGLLLKINYNLMIEEEIELLQTLKEIGCDNFDLWFENKNVSQTLEVFYAVYYIRSLMNGLGKHETTEVYSDLFPITIKNINNWYEETGHILKK